MIKKKLILTGVILILSFSVFFPVFNVNALSLMDAVPDCKDSGECEVNDFVLLIAQYVQIVFSIIGSIALLVFIYGGVVLLMSGGNSDRVSKGKQILIAAVIGIVLVFSSYMIIQFALESLGIVNEKGQFINMEGGQKWDTAPN
jgi:hypothetical protein